LACSKIPQEIFGRVNQLENLSIFYESQLENFYNYGRSWGWKFLVKMEEKIFLFFFKIGVDICRQVW
jgi:hypothetical protein